MFFGKNSMDGESPQAREERLNGLWYQLDVKRKGRLDTGDLKVGLTKMNHRELVLYFLHDIRDVY